MQETWGVCAIAGSKNFGNNLVFIEDQLNYVIPSELGRDIIANWKTTGLTNYRAAITFAIEKRRIKQIIEKDYYVATVKSIKKRGK